MLRLTLRQARATAGRLLLAGVAVALGTGFIAAVLLTSALVTRTVEASVAARYVGADVVVTAQGAPVTDADVAAAAGVPGVAAAEGLVQSGTTAVGPGGQEYVSLRSTATAPAFAAGDRRALAEGALPSSSGQVAISASSASRLGVGLGDQLRVRTYPPVQTDATGAVVGDGGPVDVPVTVVGLLGAAQATDLFDASGQLLALPGDAVGWNSWGSDEQGRPLTGYTDALVTAAPGTDAERVRDAVAAALDQRGTAASTNPRPWDDTTSADVRVVTTRQVVDTSVDDSLGGTQVLTTTVLAFAAVSLFVATTVITNTFSVIVAQRTRQLALLRCVGATKGQVRRSVLVEAGALGLVASAAGTLGGTGLAAVAAALIARAAPAVPLPSTVAVTTASVLVPVAVGVLATLVAALVPARAATRVSPLAALRPAAAPDLRTRSSRMRLATTAVLVLGGGALMVLGVLVTTGFGIDALNRLTGTSDELAVGGVAAAVLGGTASFTGVLVGAVFIVPRAVGLVGRLAARAGGVPARLAALNAVRNPRRTASTTGALLIGTTLVALMLVGAATASRTVSAALDRQYPVDLEVSTISGGVDRYGGALPAAVLSSATDVEGLASSTPVLRAEVSLAAGDTTAATGAAAQGGVYGAAGATREGFQRVLTDPSAASALAPGTAVLPREVAEGLGVTDGDVVTLRPTETTASTDLAEDGTPLTSGYTATDLDGPGRLLVVRTSDVGGGSVLLDPQDLRAVDPQAPVAALWMRLAPGADPQVVTGKVQAAVTTASDTAVGDPVSVSGMAAERASLQRVIDTVLLVVVGLLAVAVVIALVGVANTLSLSVIERTRENAVLRALGLTRGQLRGMLALEGALVAGVGGLLGVVLGSVYGWAGATSLLGGAASAAGAAAWAPSLPWARLGLLLAVAVVAGLLASVLPARRAVRTPPVAALADQ